MLEIGKGGFIKNCFRLCLNGVLNWIEICRWFPLWLSHSTNGAGHVLFDTRHRTRMTLPYLTEIENLNKLSSDHKPNLLETLCSPVSSSPTITNSFINCKKINTILTNLPNSTIRPTTNSQSIDLAIDCLTKNIQHVIEANVYTPKH